MDQCYKYSEEYKQILEAVEEVQNSQEDDENIIKNNDGSFKKLTREELANLMKSYIANIELTDDLRQALDVIYILVLKFYPCNDDEVHTSIGANVISLLKNIKKNKLNYSALQRLSIKDE